MKAAVFTLGCKVNEVESATVMAELEKLGWEVTDRLCSADVYVLNTCAVTKEAEKKSRQLLARARKFNADAPVYVCGCASQKDGASFKERGAVYIGGARDKADVVSAIIKDFGLPAADCGAPVFPKQMKTRAFIKIQDGCNNYCSYCIIPYLRGGIRSRTAKEIAAEVKATAAEEIVLTGINISAYGRERGETLTGLIRELAFTDKRVRLGSLECNVIDDGFLLALKELKDFAPQFHLSLQSGSDAVLKAMNRRYTRKEYLDKCAKIYAAFPDAAITTDIIAGFCGETEKDFSDSLKMIEQAGFARVHAFAFSPREGTRAYSMEDVPADLKRARLHRLLAAGEEAEKKYIVKRIGSVQEVIFEEFDGQYTGGYTAGYIKVYAAGKWNGRKKVRLQELYRDGAFAQIVGENAAL